VPSPCRKDAAIAEFVEQGQVDVESPLKSAAARLATPPMSELTVRMVGEAKVPSPLPSRNGKLVHWGVNRATHNGDVELAIFVEIGQIRLVGLAGVVTVAGA